VPRRRWCAAIGVALGLSTLPAEGHAPPLAARVLTPASPAAGTDEVIVTNRGLVFRNDTTGAARLLCNEALRINTAELPNVALLGDGGLLVANSSGLRLSRDQGCTWSDVGQMETTNTPALAADPNDANRVFVATYDGDNPGLHETRDAGASWSLSYATEAGDYVGSLLIAAEDPTYVYATVATYGMMLPAHSLLRTRDGGESWERRPLPLNEKDYMARVVAVSPDDPDTLLVYTVANSPGLDSSRLLVSRDGGDTFEIALERPEIRGAGFSADGRLWVAAREGLFGADPQASTFQQSSLASELGCVGDRAGSLLVCGHYAGVASGEAGVGISRDGGQSFERWFDFRQVEASVECAPESLTTSLCARPWLDWQSERDNGTLTGAGVSGAAGAGAYGPVGAAGAPGSGAAPTAPPRLDEMTDLDESSEASAGCSLAAPWPSSAPGAAAFALATLLAAARRARSSGSRGARAASARAVSEALGIAPDAGDVPGRAGVYPCPFGFAVSVPLGPTRCLVPMKAESGAALAPIASALALAHASGGIQATAERMPTVEMRLVFERMPDVGLAAQRIQGFVPELLKVGMDAVPGYDPSDDFRVALELRTATARALSVHLYVKDTSLSHERGLSRYAERLRPVLAALVGVAPRLETHFILRRRVNVRCRIDLVHLVRRLPEREARDPRRCAAAILQGLARLDAARSQPALAAAQNALVLASIGRVASALGNDARRIRAEGHCHAARFGVVTPLARSTLAGRYLDMALELPIGAHWRERRSDPEAVLANSLVPTDSIEGVGSLAAAIGLGAHLAAFEAAVVQVLTAERRLVLPTLPDGSPPDESPLEEPPPVPDRAATTAPPRGKREISGIRPAIDARRAVPPRRTRRREHG
jgi:photosystem II stability/assembly factor-like uncharacterized protein